MLSQEAFSSLFDDLMGLATVRGREGETISAVLERHNVQPKLPPQALRTLGPLLNSNKRSGATLMKVNKCAGCGFCGICGACLEADVGSAIIAVAALWVFAG